MTIAAIWFSMLGEVSNSSADAGKVAPAQPAGGLGVSTMISTILTAALLLTDAAAAAPPQDIHASATAVQAPAAEAQKKVSPDEKVCHTTQMLGSRLPVKLCSTARQDAMRKFEDRQLIEGAQRIIDPGH